MFFGLLSTTVSILLACAFLLPSHLHEPLISCVCKIHSQHSVWFPFLLLFNLEEATSFKICHSSSLIKPTSLYVLLLFIPKAFPSHVPREQVLSLWWEQSLLPARLSFPLSFFELCITWWVFHVLQWYSIHCHYSVVLFLQFLGMIYFSQDKTWHELSKHLTSQLTSTIFLEFILKITEDKTSKGPLWVAKVLCHFGKWHSKLAN